MRIKKIIFLTINYRNLAFIFVNYLLLAQFNVYASFELKGSSARIQAMGQTYVGLANTPEAIFVNSSGLAQLSSIAFSFYFANPFGIKELSFGSMAAIFPTSIGTYAMGLAQFGNKLYGEQSLLLSYARSIQNRFYYGFNLHYMKLQINDYGSDFSYGIDLGFLTKITSSLNWGFNATNLNRATLGKEREKLPQTFCTGISVSFGDQLILNMDIFKDSMFPLELRTGVEYILFNRLALRSGFSTEPTQFAAGVGLLFFLFEVDYAVTTHKDLGLTHNFSIQLQLRKIEKNNSFNQNNFKVESVTITKININTASSEQLQKIPGIGKVLAHRIIVFRYQNGKFSSIEQLLLVKGIGETKLEKIKPYIFIGE